MPSPGSTADVDPPWPWEAMPAAQQPTWREHAAYQEARRTLALARPLVSAAETRHLRGVLSHVTRTDALLLQLGDCAESLEECSAFHTAKKLRVIDVLADRFSDLTGRSVIRVGRMGGQFAKPRSQDTERHGEFTVPSFRGHMINSEIATPTAREPDPSRMLWAYDAGDTVQRAMRTHRRGHERERNTAGQGPWSSHEALVIDYETPLVRRDADTGELYLTSTHLPWVGERTRQPGGAHVALLASVANPVGCKIGPATTPDEVLTLCRALDPGREPGRLVLIPRMGRTRIREVLGPIVRRVAHAGHPVIWLCDPMHGNTVTSSSGRKTRRLTDVIAEALSFRDIVEENRQYAAGLHIEVAAEEVTECIGGSVESEADLGRHYTSLCDPRLNVEQAGELIEAWAKGAATGRP
ncbi:3-deoxy-7-phosphoheptulonate synthase [Streptomyces sp. NPDC052236]|uniref:3-deoxy-7-phosphoheptulonate synthase n=1 Tax=Streptomyces sp. NPDC052236 TaxID=3365686 RepID=UPI0037D036C2